MIEKDIDYCLLSSTDRKWTNNTKDRMLGRLKKVNKDIVISISDSSKYNEMKTTWMLGGTFSYILGKWSMIVIENDSDLKGRWSTFTLEANAKRILIVNVYRITKSTTKGLYTVKA